MKDGENIRFTGEGDQEPGLEPGDIIIVLDEKEHRTFRRHDNDLIMEMDLELVEALCGFQKTIDTLDKRVLLLTNLPGKYFLLCFRHLSESCFLLGALHKRSKFANFCHDLMQNHLS